MCSELPGLILSAILVDKIGRRMSMALMYSFGFTCLLPLMFQQHEVVAISLLFGARMFIIGNYTVAGIYCPEVSCSISHSTFCHLKRKKSNISFFHSTKATVICSCFHNKRISAIFFLVSGFSPPALFSYIRRLLGQLELVLRMLWEELQA